MCRRVGIGNFQQYIRVAVVARRAPASKVLAAKFLSDALADFVLVAQGAELGNGFVSRVRYAALGAKANVVRVAVPCRARYLHRVWRHAPTLAATQLYSSRLHVVSRLHT
jgi:hypothetical protein